MNKIFKKTMSLAGGLTLLVMLNSPVLAANTVQFTQGNIINAASGGSLTVDLIGSNFTEGPDGAAFSLAWNPSVLDYVNTIIANPPWDISSVTDTTAASGLIDFVFLNKNVGDAGSDFALASFTFNVLGNPGSVTTLGLSNDPYNVGFVSPGAVPINVNYINSIVQVAPVPIPTAAWLFGTSLMGFMVSMRSRRMLSK